MSNTQEWHYTDSSGQQQGPISADALQQLAINGSITTETQVWTEGMDEWAPASQVEGLISEQAPAPDTHAHEPQINLSPQASGINLGPSIQAKPMGQSLTTQYSQPKKSPAKWIVSAVILALAIAGGIYLANSGGDDEPKTTLGLETYTKANERLSACKTGSAFGNSSHAGTIGKQFLATINPPKAKAESDAAAATMKEASNNDKKSSEANASDDAEKKPSAPEKIELALHCQTSEVDGEKAVALLIKIPNLHNLDPAAKQALLDRLWASARLSLANTPYGNDQTKLLVALRGLTSYDCLMSGVPAMTQAPEKQPREGLAKTWKGKDAELKLPPFFIEKQ
ncbi:DUF4339 domain-containing protein [Verrucomicrobiaceae bacterium N1E253]|uniref:DUF4339 domain-containing protein n=1 Tax=Oceaniferula marina TaxID=2748318 RepID=A0A851GMZ6_9BACT|nr:DUF4339 domain-containing protein [Oceaniferula marina]NWK56397.1 DUF4339 domain-containing protein [Oceaniferula marina]